MKIRLAPALGLLFIAGIPLVVAQDRTAPHESYQYDAANQMTWTGIVEAVKEYQCPVSGTVGTHLTVRLTNSSLEVHLAPAKFIKTYEIVINKGDQVEIQGVKIMLQGKPTLIAKTVAIDRTTFAFRDGRGRPLW